MKGNYVLYKIYPSEEDLIGDLPAEKNSHGLVFLNSDLEVRDGVFLFTDPIRKSIEGVFPIDKYFVLSKSDK